MGKGVCGSSKSVMLAENPIHCASKTLFDQFRYSYSQIDSFPMVKMDPYFARHRFLGYGHN